MKFAFKILFTLASLTLMAFSCSEEHIEQDEPNEKEPKIILDDNSSLLIYPAEQNKSAEIIFETINTTSVKVSTDFSAKNEIIQLNENNWKVNISEAKGMQNMKAYHVTITAENKYCESKKNIIACKAFLENPFTKEEPYPVSGYGITYSFSINSNIEWYVDVETNDKNSYELNSTPSSISFKIKPNETTLSREFKLTVSDINGYYKYTRTFTQKNNNNSDDIILAKENTAMLALNKALNLGCDTTKHHSEWGIAMYNDKGYVTNIMLSNYIGKLPEEIGDLQYCVELDLNMCKLSGELPKRIGEMKKLKTLLLGSPEGYGLEGNLSESSLSQIANHLYNIHLGGNNFTGPCPEWLGDTPDGCLFTITGNRLSGKIPEKVQKHPSWNSVIPDGSGRLVKDLEMIQQEGYILYE